MAYALVPDGLHDGSWKFYPGFELKEDSPGSYQINPKFFGLDGIHPDSYIVLQYSIPSGYTTTILRRTREFSQNKLEITFGYLVEQQDGTVVWAGEKIEGTKSFTRKTEETTHTWTDTKKKYRL
jgi:hypothetical protein